MNANIRTFVLGGSLAALALASGCVADRPSRNGVFNENQYLRKDFLVRGGNDNASDPGWFMKETIISTSTPNPLAPPGFVTGAENGGMFVRFQITQDKLNMLNVREISSGTNTVSGDPNATDSASVGDQGTRTAEVTDAWPVSNVDLKYRVNLDGEKTNFYEENQELDWQARQWIKINFAKNDTSDMGPLGPFATEFIARCTDSTNLSATLVPNSLVTEENDQDHSKDYFQFKVEVTLPIEYQGTPPPGAADSFCTDQFGAPGVDFARMGRNNVTMTIMYSFMRAKTADQITYKPLVREEKDPIQRKYGTIDYLQTPARDPNTGLLGTRALSIRYDPAKDIVVYFAKGYPQYYEKFFTDAGGIVDQTNAVLATAGATGKLKVLRYNDKDNLGDGGGPNREYGDIRYTFIRWVSDLDSGAQPALAFTEFVPDPRTGEVISNSINVFDWWWKDSVLARLDFYEQSIGAVNWGDPGPCKDGDVLPLVPANLAANHNGSSTLYGKMQQYLSKPSGKYGLLGPADFIVQQDADFFRAYYAILPYEVFADPAMNSYVIPEGGSGTYGPIAQVQAMQGEATFHQLMSQIDHGIEPFDVSTGAEGVQQGLAFLDQLKKSTLAHRDYSYLKQFRYPMRREDDVDMFAYTNVFARDARHCINGAWETRDQYVQNMIASYYAQTVWHEFGHLMGLEHNFMASVDRNNFPHYQDAQGRDHVGLYAASLMDYNITADRVFWAGAGTANSTGKPGWAPYDAAAIAYIYANSGSDINATSSANASGVRGNSVSGQSGTASDGTTVTSANARWKDPLGFDKQGNEIQFLYCGPQHEKYSPFCRGVITHDFGTTPSEIIAAQIDNYEWQYLWRNFRQYHKYFDFSQYADGPASFFTDLRRFMSTWAYDWSAGELADTLRRLGIAPPQGVPANQYYDQLALKFNHEVSAANSLVAAVHEAVIQQASGQRPYRTTFDNFFGDTTQQGIVIDKLLALQGFTALWQTGDNYDPGQAQGGYISAYSFGDQSYSSVAEPAVTSMIGGQYDIFPFAIPLGVLQFSQATHDTNFVFTNRPDVRDWIGGHVFYRERDFLDYFKGIAVNSTFTGEDGKLCTSIDSCAYDPRRHATGEDPLQKYHSDNYQQFMGPDFRRWIWSYVADRNQWLAVDRDRNIATYVITYNYNADVIFGEDDGNIGPAYGLQLPLKYFLDYFNQMN